MLNDKNKKLIIITVAIIIFMIVGLGLVYFFVARDNNKKTEIKPRTTVPENSVGAPYVDKPGAGKAVTETPVQSYDLAPIPLPEAPPAPR